MDFEITDVLQRQWAAARMGVTYSPWSAHEDVDCAVAAGYFALFFLWCAKCA